MVIGRQCMHKPTTLGKHRSEMHLNRAASWLKARLDGAPLGSQSGPSSVDDGVSTTKSLLHPCLTLCCHAAELKLLIPFSSLMVNDNSSSCRADCVAKPETTKHKSVSIFSKDFPADCDWHTCYNKRSVCEPTDVLELKQAQLNCAPLLRAGNMSLCFCCL